jgi:aminopeptidase YwaD
MTCYKALPVIFLWFAGHTVNCQDSAYAREIIRRLCDKSMHGRGYVRNGDHKAANYIRKQYENDGILPFETGFYQSFPISANTFPGAMKVSLNRKLLVPGRDFIVDPASPGLKGSFIPLCLDASDILKGKSDTLASHAGNRVLIVDSRNLATEKPDVKRLWNEWINSQLYNNPFKIRALIEITDEKLIFGAATQLSLIPLITIRGTAFINPVTSLDIHIRNKFDEEYRTGNVVGYIPGTSCPDSFLVYTAHYDHLGRMGKGMFFPGANDNASGTSMMLVLARYFSRHPQRYSVAFIGFTGEEAGLLGSGFFVNHPLFSLMKIKFLVNLDLVGTGIDGITVVNATEFPGKFELLSQINDTGSYIINIKKRGKACNSDHCPFYTNGVPCFFIYTLGGIAAYHNLDDRPETLPLTAFDGLTRLLIEFGERLK